MYPGGRTIVFTASGPGSLPLRVGAVARSAWAVGSLGYHHAGTSSAPPPLEVETGTGPIVKSAPHSGHFVCFPACRSSALNALPQVQTTRIMEHSPGSNRHRSSNRSWEQDCDRTWFCEWLHYYLCSRTREQEPSQAPDWDDIAAESEWQWNLIADLLVCVVMEWLRVLAKMSVTSMMRLVDHCGGAEALGMPHV